MRHRATTTSTTRTDHESGVSHLVEYMIISGILVLLLIIMVPMVNEAFIERPANYLTSYAYIDIGNGISTRIIDLYAIIPYGNNATIVTRFDIPDDVAGRDYWVEIDGNNIVVSGGSGISTTVSLAGIGETAFGRSGGNTTASGLNYIEYQYP